MQGTSINSITGFYCNNDISSGCFIRIQNELAIFTIGHICLSNINSYLCIYIALISNISTNSTSYIFNVAISIYNRYSNVVILVNNTCFFIKCKIEGVIRINNRQFSSNRIVSILIYCNDIDSSTQQAFVVCDISFGFELICIQIASISINSFSIEAILNVSCINSDTIFILIFSLNSYGLAKGYFVSDIHVLRFKFTILVIRPVLCCHFKNKVFSFAKITKFKSSSSSFPTQQTNLNSIFARNQVFDRIAVIILQGESAIIERNKFKIICSQGRTFRSNDAQIFAVSSIISIDSWFSCRQSGNYATFFVGNFEQNGTAHILNSIVILVIQIIVTC